MGGALKTVGSLFGSIGGGIAEGAGATSNFQASLDPAVLEQQQAFINALQQQQMGLGPSVAQVTLNQAMNANLTGAMGMAAAQRGVNPALAARQAQQAQAQAQMQAAGQAATLRAQEQLGAQGMLGNALAQRQQQNLAVQQINAGTAAQNAQMNAQVTGGLMSAIGGGATAMAGGKWQGGMVDGYADGGTVGPSSTVSRYLLNTNPIMASNGATVPGVPLVPGDNPVNDTVPARLSPGEIVIPNSILQGKNPGEESRKFVEQEIAKSKKKDDLGFAEGGEVPWYAKPGGLPDIPEKGLAGQAVADEIRMAQNFRNTQVPAPLAMATDMPGGQTLPMMPEHQPTQPQTAQEATQPQSPTSTQPLDTMGIGAQSKALMSGIGQQKAGLMQEAQATGQLGQEQAAILEQQNQQLAQRQITFEQRMADLDAKRQAFVKDINDQKINPNQYMSNLSTGGKIATMVGLILGGIGGGLSGRGGNMAMDTLNNLINRDIEAQRAEMDKKKNLLSANLAEMGSLKDAEMMTRSMMMDTFSNQLKVAAAKAQDPISKARAMQAAGLIDTQNAQLIGQLAMKQAITQGTGQGRIPIERQINMIIPERDQQKAREELSMVQGYKQATKGVSKLFSDALTIGGVEGNIPFSKSKAELGKIRANITNVIRQNMKGQGSFSDQDQKVLIDPLLPEATDTVAQIRQKEKGILNILADKVGPGTPTLKGYGINLDVGTAGLNTQEQRALNWAKQNPNTPEAKAIMKKLEQ